MELQRLRRIICRKKGFKKVKSKISKALCEIKHKLFCSHTLKRHYNGKVYECHCGSIFTENYILKTHQLVHSSQHLVSDTCQVCHKIFKTKACFKNHWMKHHFEKHGPADEKVVVKADDSKRKFSFR